MLKNLFPALPEVGRMPYFWLAYLLMLYFPYLYRPPAAMELLRVALVSVVFLALYFRSFYHKDAKLWCYALAIAALGVYMAKYNANALVFFVYSACCGAGFARIRDGYLLIGATIVLAAFTGWLYQLGLSYFIPALVFPLVVGVPVLLMSAMGRQHGQLLRKQEEVEQLAKIAERERISRDMHDVLGHSLSVIALKAELAGKLLARKQSAHDVERAQQEIIEVGTTARALLMQLREAVAGYRSAGLAHEINQAKNALASADIVLHGEIDASNLPAAVENVIALCLREGITNILRHSQASECQFTLALRDRRVHCSLTDNGQANAGHKIDPDKIALTSNGLRGMRERIEALGGELQINLKHANQPGFALSWWLPLTEPKLNEQQEQRA